MKKIIALLLLLLLLAYIGASFFAGVMGEKNIRQQLALSQAHANAQGVVFELADYRRGIFSSQFQLIAQVSANKNVVDTLTITSDAKVKHGPLFFAQGLTWGVFYATADTALITNDVDINHFLNSAFNDTLGRLSVHGHFDNTYTAAWETPAMHYAEQGQSLTIDGLRIVTEGRVNASDMNGEFTLGAVNYQATDDGRLEMTPLSGNFTLRLLADNIPLTDISAQVEQLNLSVAGTAPVVIRDIRFSQNQNLRDALLQSGFRLDAATIDSMVALENIYYSANLDGLSVDAANAWADYGASGTYSLEFDDTLRHALALTFTDQLALTLASGAELFGGRFTHSIDLQTLPQYQGYRVSEVDNLVDLLAFITGSSELRVSKSVVTGSILILFLAEYLDSYLIEQGDDYVFKATLEDGVLRFADVEWPLAQFISTRPPAEGL